MLLFSFLVGHLLISSLDCAKILCVFHMPPYSHFQLGDRISTALAERGHEVTIITPYTPKKQLKNTKHVVLTGVLEKFKVLQDLLFGLQDLSKFEALFVAESMGLEITENTLSHPNVKNFINTNETFDLVILEPLINEALTGFCYHSKAHCVLLSTVGVHRMVNTRMGNPGSPSYLSEMMLGYHNMNFAQRIHNTFMYVCGTLIHQLYGFPRQNDLLHKHFPNMPHLSKLYYNTSLMLLNSDPSTNQPTPLLPNMIEIGSYHVKLSKPLPEGLAKFMNESKNGVICFSLGSNLKSSGLPVEKRNAILRAFSKLKYDVLWKWEDDNLPNKPNNVKIEKWLPLSDLLAHPNMKLLLTHGGLLSTTESIYHGVPFVGIPIFGDQELNMNMAESSEFSIKVPFKTLTEETLSRSLNEVLNNPKYLENLRKRTKIMHDQPMKPIDKAVFWIEYVIRHDGAYHLRSAALNLAWYQYLLLDVIALITTITGLALCVLYKIMKFVFLLCKPQSRNSSSIKKNN